MREKWIRVTLSLILCMAMLLGNLPAVNAVEVMPSDLTNENGGSDGQLGSGTPDSKPPVLVGLELSDDTVTSPGTVEVTIEATDEVSGLAHAEVYFECAETNKELYCWLEASYYDEATKQRVPYADGKLHGTLEIDQYVETGTFFVRTVHIRDVADNYAHYYSNRTTDYPPREFVMPAAVKAVRLSVTESDTPDSEPPVLQGIELSQNHVAAPGTLEVTMEATDEVSGLAHAEVYFECAETNKELYCWLEASYYDETTKQRVPYADGKLHGTLEIDQYVETGTFFVRTVHIRDVADNYAHYYSNRTTDYPPREFVMPAAVKAVRFSVTESDTPDGDPPVLQRIELSRDRVTAPGMLEVTMDATDEVSGLAHAEVYFECAETNKELYCWLEASYYDEATKRRVPYADGKLHGTLEIDQYVETGTFFVRTVHIRDVADNYAHYYSNRTTDYPPREFVIPAAVKDLSLYVINTIPDVTTSVSKPEFVEQIEQAEDGSYIVADFSSDSELPEEAFDAIAGTNKTLELTSEGITWRFSGVDIVNDAKPIDLAVEITTAEETGSSSGQAIQDALNDTPGIVMKFAENGELPGAATIQVKVDYAMREYLGADQNLCIYYYNNQTGEMELVAENLQVIDDTYVEFTITHCSYYVLTTRLPENTAELIDSGTCGDNMTWTLDTNGLLTISGSGEMYNFGYNDGAEAPWFDIRDQIVTVVVEGEVTALGSYSLFFCNNLTSISLPGSLQLVCEAAMAWNDNLESVTFDGPAPYFYQDTFMDTGSSVSGGTTCYYPANDPTWDAVINNGYGSPVNWVCRENGDNDLPADYDWTLTADTYYVTVGDTVYLESLGNDGEPVKGMFCEWQLSNTALAQLSSTGYQATLYAKAAGTLKVTLETALGRRSVDIVIEHANGATNNAVIELGHSNLLGAWSTINATFTPPWGSDEYVFFVEGDNADWSIGFDHEVDIVPHRTFGAYGYRMMLQDGVTYNVQIQNYSGRDLHVRMMSISPDAPDMSFPADTQEHAYVGDEWGFPVLPIPPDGKLGNNIRWSVDNPNVVKMTAEDDHVTLNFLSAGVVTLTALDVNSGKSAKHTITVYDEQGNGNNGNTIEFYGNGGTFEVTTAENTWSAVSYGYPVPAGETMGDYVVNISDLVFWNPNRAFTKWMACTHENIYNDQGEKTGEDNIQIPGTTLMTTAEALAYPARFDGKTVIMLAQWEGDEFDYYSDVGFEVLGGTLIINPVGEEEPFETPAPGGRCREDGSTIGSQLWFTIPDDPTHEKYVFEGWLQYNEETGELINETTLTFAQIQTLTVPSYNVRFIAKWSGYDMDFYRNLYTQGNDGCNVYVAGGWYGRFTTLKNGECVSGTSGTVWMQIPVGSSLMTEGYEFIEWEPYPEHAGEIRNRIGWYVGTQGENGNFERLPGSGLLSDSEMLSYQIPADMQIIFEAQWDGEGDPVIPEDGYTAGFATTTMHAAVGDKIYVPFTVNHSEDAYFNAGELVFRFDSNQLDCVGVDGLFVSDMKYADGAMTLEFYGNDQLIQPDIPYYLVMEVKSADPTEIILESAAFINKEDAVRSDLIPATLVDNVCTIESVSAPYTVTKPACYEGPDTVNAGEDYVFYAQDWEYYTYTVEATMGAIPAQVEYLGNGVYVIRAVSGNLELSGSRVAKKYTVSVQGTAAADMNIVSEATYGEDYSFSIPKGGGCSYVVRSILIGGIPYTDYSIQNSVCTIAGRAIKGDVVITVDKTETIASVYVEGNGAGAAEGYNESAELGKPYTLTIHPAAGYSYTVTATMNGEPAEVIDNGDNTYTIKKVTGDIVFTVTRKLVTDAVTVSQYLKVNGANVWMVKFAAEVEPGKMPTYDGKPMYWSDEYDAYCYLVITEMLDEEEAKSKLDITDGTAPVLGDSMDVNGSGKIDASDAQLVYNMYNAMYGAFDGDVTMEKYFRADINKDGQINVQDAAAIIAKILE